MTPTPHIHAALIKQWADAPEWWDVYSRSARSADYHQWALDLEPKWSDLYEYQLRKSAKHPDNIKPKKRLIDWSKMPRGTLTNRGEFLKISDNVDDLALCLSGGSVCETALTFNLRLAEQTQFTYWGGGECPVPEGLSLEILSRGNGRGPLPSCVTSVWQHSGDTRDIIAYRITGLADGWTDNPEEAV